MYISERWPSKEIRKYFLYTVVESDTKVAVAYGDTNEQVLITLLRAALRLFISLSDSKLFPSGYDLWKMNF